MVNRAAKRDADINARLAVIEERLETVLAELGAIRKHIPATLVEHSERIEVLERNMRAIQWLGGILATALVAAFIGHILGV
ncbi:MAG TPA: hypothetical protein VMX94_10340 [Armatimonadota bacterium]|nr:hypothetical protein [Armatimonadota bacterium]